MSALLKSDISVQSCEGRGDPQLIKFGVYCTNHLLLPMLQSWLRRCQRTFQGWLASGPNFKHCMGRTTELVMTWLKGPYTYDARKLIRFLDPLPPLLSHSESRNLSYFCLLFGYLPPPTTHYGLHICMFPKMDMAAGEYQKSLTLSLKQVLLVLIECTVVPVESIARLGCSCLR